MDLAVTTRADGIVLLAVCGALDIDTAPRLRDAVHGLLDSGTNRIVVDLAGVDFCDSVGLGTFAYGHNHCRASGGALRLAAPSPFLAGLLATVGLAGPIPIHDTVTAALRASAPVG